ncbi:MAG: hypothetical protein ABI650_09115 [Dokdonella sp.]
MDYPFVRWGVNSTTRYNGQADVCNTAFDGFFMNIADGNGTPSTSSVVAQVTASLAAGSASVVMIGTIGWTPLLVRQKRWLFSVIVGLARADRMQLLRCQSADQVHA